MHNKAITNYIIPFHRNSLNNNKNKGKYLLLRFFFKEPVTYLLSLSLSIIQSYNNANRKINIPGSHPIIDKIKAIDTKKLVITKIGNKIHIQIIPRKKNR